MKGWIVCAQAFYEVSFKGVEGWRYEFEERLKSENPKFLYGFYKDFCGARDSALREN